MKAPDQGPRLATYQAWWGMMDIGEDGREWTDEEKLGRIADAGFEGILLFDDLVGDRGDAWRALLDEHGLALAVGTYAVGRDELRTDVQRAAELGATFVNAQMMDYFLVGEAAEDAVRSTVELGREAGVPCLLETHRACVTQDLLRTVDYVQAVPDVLLAIDFSHYVVAGQVPVGPGEIWPIRPEFEDGLELLLQRTAAFHGRVSNGHLVQIDVGPQADHPAVAHFRRWWASGMRHWREQAQPGDVLSFVVELGPFPYSITPAHVPSPGAELSDRWAQALVLQRLATDIWADVAASDRAPA
jgi:hypothetical protein